VILGRQRSLDMAFDLLPAELQIATFSYLKARDLKSARATCRKFRDNASPALFRSVVTGARYRALQAFQNIAARSVLQPYIKEIIFDGSSYDGTLAKNQSAYEYSNNEIYQVNTFWGTRTKYVQSVSEHRCN
jgi:hypothetical protein